MVSNIPILIGACLAVPMGIFLASLGYHTRGIGLGACGTAIAIFGVITVVLCVVGE